MARNTESKLIKLAFLNSRQSPEISGEGLQQAKVNYFKGNDPEKWRTDIPTYKAVLYSEVWPGIDIRFYGNNRELEHDIIVKPGADPAAIKFSCEGMDGGEVNKEGDLEIEVGEGRIIQKRPHIYQEIGGRRVEIAGGFRVDGQECNISNQKTDPAAMGFFLTYGFEISVYNRDYPLIIDPVLIYSSYLGGNSALGDQGQGIAVDDSGNAYITGYTSSQNFPTVSPIQGGLAGDYDAFVTKINPSGTALVYSTYLGGNDDDWGLGISIDSTGNAYIGGRTFSTNFPTASPLQGKNAGNFDVFVTKINPEGNALVYSTYLGGGGEDWSWGIAIDTSGSAYVTGHTQGNFPLVSPIQGTYGGGEYDAFVAKINSAGSALVYSTYLGGSALEHGRSIAVDISENAYITGMTYSANFPTASPFQGSYAGNQDAFITKISASGNALAFSTYLGGGGLDAGYGISADTSGNAYITGKTASANFPTASPIQESKAGSDDVFVTKINPTGSTLVYSTFLGASGTSFGRGISVDTSGNVYIAGEISGTIPTVSPIQGSNAGKFDAFVTKINSLGSALVYSTYLGGSESDYGMGIAVDGAGNAYVTGGTFSSDFPVKVGPYLAYGGTRDAFAAKIYSSSRDDFVGTWDGQGVYYRNTLTGQWVRLTSPVDSLTAGDIDGDGASDLIGVFSSGLWVKSSSTRTWTKLSSNVPLDIASGDMNGDGRDDVVGSWTSGVWYRNSITGSWVLISSTSATRVAAGDINKDGSDDLIGVWTNGLWMKNSVSGNWVKLSGNVPLDVASGDLSGDGRDDVLGTWSAGIWYRDSASGGWVLMSSSSATRVAAGAIDSDAADDLIGVWPTGVWVKNSIDSSWERISLTFPRDIEAGLFSEVWGSGSTDGIAPLGGFADSPESTGRPADYSSEGPGGWQFAYQREENLIPLEKAETIMRIPGPGEPGFQFDVQENLVPHKDLPIEHNKNFKIKEKAK